MLLHEFFMTTSHPRSRAAAANCCVDRIKSSLTHFAAPEPGPRGSSRSLGRPFAQAKRTAPHVAAATPSRPSYERGSPGSSRSARSPAK